MATPSFTTPNQQPMSKKLCPECGAETIVETHTDHIGSFKERRCTGLVEIEVNKPLEACGWSEYVGDNPEQPIYFGIGIQTSQQ